MTLLLLELYRTYRTQFRSAKHIKNVWQKIAADMNNKGHKLMWQICEKKFRNMKGTFKEIKDHNRKSGRGRKQWPYLELFNELMGNEPAIKSISGWSRVEGSCWTDRWHRTFHGSGTTTFHKCNQWRIGSLWCNETNNNWGGSRKRKINCPNRHQKIQVQLQATLAGVQH